VRTAALLIIGDEILSGEIEDTNAPAFLRRCREVGIPVRRLVVVGDDAETIASELTRLRALADAVVLSGGLGPTHDDETRLAVARALGLELERHPQAAERIRGYYGEKTTDADLSMASFPAGARLVVGPETGSFGFEVGGVYALPGVPFLFRDIVEGLLPDFEGAPLHRHEIFSHLREGELAPRLADFQGRWRDVAIGSYPECIDGDWRVRVVLRGADQARVAALAGDLTPHIA
jgi:molybdenum cofactor synthesis domain-containing protein